MCASPWPVPWLIHRTYWDMTQPPCQESDSQEPGRNSFILAITVDPQTVLCHEQKLWKDLEGRSPCLWDSRSAVCACLGWYLYLHSRTAEINGSYISGAVRISWGSPVAALLHQNLGGGLHQVKLKQEDLLFFYGISFLKIVRILLLASHITWNSQEW